MAVSDLPPPDEPMTVDAYRQRWPTGAEKVELLDGTIVFYGTFDANDAEAAALVYPGRRVLLSLDGGIEVHPAGPPTGVWADRLK
ncbi:MAG TPA: hypothetical protein VMU51_26090 [Mycobacteriales bacterium]|jgi:hypothetical protein|nr:hypothetical protein [Mycobacteriales bacterium]